MAAFVAFALVVASVGVGGIGGVPAVDAASSDVVINEILYHPEDDDPNGEFIELYNRGSARVDLSGWCIDGISYCFRRGFSIEPKGFFLLTSRFYEGRLSNGGEDLRLIDAAGDVVEEFEYDDKKQWPANTDGEGASLQRLNVNTDPADPGNWWGDVPTPGGPNRNIGSAMPVWDDVDHTRSPAPGQVIEIDGEVDGARRAWAEVRIGFGPVVRFDMTLVGSDATTTIPGQAAGALVRYRLVAEYPNGVKGTWPRQGDGAGFTGTVVRSPSTTDLPRFQWFMEDAVYEQARNDLTLTGDDGYPAVFAYDGEIFDNMRVRVKGQVSRSFPKKKWKFVLPAGHEFEIDGVFPEAVDEFALHSSWTDKSFIRETLASEALQATGIPASQAFPVQLERNGGFFGLYSYIEQPDGTWRDRFGLDDAMIYEVGGGRAFGLLAANDANLSQEILRRKYEKETREFENDDRLRELIRVTNGLRGQALREWIFANVDVPSVVNALATNLVIQHQDIGHKNYRLVLNTFGKWMVIPNDLDLTFGRRYGVTCGSLCESVGIGGAFEHPGQPLFRPFWFDPVLHDMVKQRIRTVAEEVLVPEKLGPRIAELRDAVADEARRDRSVWGTYRSPADPATQANLILSNFVIPQRNRILGPLAAQNRVARTSAPESPAIEISRVEYDDAGGIPPHIVLTNRGAVTADLSGFTLDELDTVVSGGTILVPGASAVLIHEDAVEVGTTFSCCLIAGVIRDDIDDAEDGFVLANRRGAPLASWTLVPPREMTKFEGPAGRSAFINLTVTDTNGGGYLQILPCDDEPGTTSNLNVDGRRQTRAGAAIVRFDGDGELCVFNQSAAQVIVDLQGVIDDAAIDDVDDVRVLDTRGAARPVAGSQTEIAGRPNSSAFVSIVAVDNEGVGWLQALPCGSPPGGSSNLNVDAPRQVRATLAVVQFDAAGSACLYTSVGTHIVADVQAYLADSALDDVPDTRLLDTRPTVRPAAGSITVIEGEPNRSALLSVIAVDSTGYGWVQVLPCGATPGGSSNVNVDSPHQQIANLAVVRFGAAGRACVYTSAATDLVVDLQAYFTGAAFDDVPDERLADTRRR